MKSLYELKNIEFYYQLGSQKIHALRGIDLSLEPHCFTCFSGPSGSGKSTLLSLLGLIEPPQIGEISFLGKNLKQLSEAEKNKIRRYEIGFVFQTFHLFPVFTAEENVEYFLTRQGLKASDRKARVKEALDSVGLWEHRHKKPLEMSGGQRQRVAIARAIAKKPQVIIADEPTASLDQVTGTEIMKVFQKIHQQQGTTLLVCSHDPMVLSLCPTRYHLVDGKLSQWEEEYQSPQEQLTFPSSKSEGLRIQSPPSSQTTPHQEVQS